MTSPSSPVPDLEDAIRPPSIRLTDLPLFPAASASCTSKTNRPNSESSLCFDTSRDTSIRVFRRWLIKNGTEIDASKVVSKACFDDWCLGRSSGQLKKGLSRTFESVLKSHIAGSDGRQPFEPDEEAAILKVIRKKQIWPAFIGTEWPIGYRGYRGLSYHERHQTLIAYSNESLIQQQTLVARYLEDPTFLNRNRKAVKAKFKRGAAELPLPHDIFFKQVEMVYPSITQQLWMHAPSTLPIAITYSHPCDEMLQNQLAYSPLLGMHNQPLVVPNGYFNPVSFPLSHVFIEQTIAQGRLAFNNGQPYG